MNRKVVLLVIVPVLLSSAISGMKPTRLATTDTSDLVVGVDVGDWVKYAITASFTSNSSTPEPPYDLIELEKIEWVKNTVLAISGTNITFERRVHLEDGNETESVEYVDIKTGASSEIGTLMFIAADLAKGNSVNASTTEEYRINETVTRTYKGVTREINHLNVSTVYDDPFTDDISLFTADYYWDKTTGVLCERPGTYVNYIEGLLTSLAVNEKMIDTNLWGANTHPLDGVDFSAAIIIGVSVVFIGFLAVTLIWRQKGKRVRRSKS